jgi:hypothetical protein
MARSGSSGGADVRPITRPTTRNHVTPYQALQRDRQSARRAEAVALRVAGMTFAQIGEKLGISKQAATDLVRVALSRAEALTVDELRSQENLRLDRAQASIWAAVLSGDLAAVNTFLNISARRARLNGLDAPTKINLSVSVKQEMETALRELEAVVLADVIPAAAAEDPDHDD